ncbi:MULTISPECIES: hypothetical protein [Achromobacter]|uniref:Uncharacterized protein n=1 Tax=Achromobacter spanius TaxID=217203 RepID=A0ABY8GTA6_9BURK|nr:MULTISPECIES: hypothetical protein [Achromobacter]WAI82750.1 hypothetical protein N8Z00_25110 [Achromobacter spanius]WEX92836.1 hypothetical protein N3Z32_19710 [Achromobacter sp. SS2-2022]WFP08012.1 hypothetical protein P8T11_27550 [Achromobacter spanius]
MNTADFSVLSDELVVSLNPLRRGAHRARAVCARLTGLAMPWTSASAGGERRDRSRSGTAPARWPFPPAPVEEGTLVGQAVSVPMPAPVSVPVSAPVSVPVSGIRPVIAPAVAPATPASVARERSLGNATVEPVSSQVTMKAMVLDVVMVLAWGAIIPGLMWLGAAAGF